MRREPDTADGVVAGLAALQYGAVSFAQLRSAGLSKGAIARRVKAGRLYRAHQGVYAVGYPRLPAEGAWMAAILACGSDAPRLDGAGEPPSTQTPTRSVLEHWGAVLSHRSAATLWRLLPPADGLVHVSVSGIAGKEKRRGVHVHRSRTLVPEMATTHRGIPVTTPARIIADLRRAAVTRGCPAAIPLWELRRAIRQAEVIGLPTGAEHQTKRTRSDLELAFLRLCRRHGLPRPEVNAWIDSLQVDFLWRGRRLVVETDGYRYHRGRAAFDKDRDRDLELRALRYEVVRVSERQVDEEPVRVAGVLKLSLFG